MFDIFGHKYPYQDAHELNLDWFLSQFKPLFEKYKDIEKALEDFYKTFDDKLSDTVKAEINKMYDDGRLSKLIAEADGLFRKNVLAYGVDNTGRTDASLILNDIIKNGGCFYIPTGTYLLEHTLVIPSNTSIVGDGFNTVLLSAPNLDAVYHTVCNKNASDIDARIAYNEEYEGHPAVHDYIDTLDKNIYLSNFCINGNWPLRNLVNWNKYYHNGDYTISREYGTGLELQAVRNCIVDNVFVINAIQHGINVRGASYSYSRGYDYVAEIPSYNVVIRNCTVRNERIDDCITTHDSYNILIDNCHCDVSNNANGTYTKAISNGIEIDDGSSFVTVRNCVVEYAFCGYQAKGHNNTPSAHDIKFIDCVARHTHIGFSCSTGGGSWAGDDAMLTGRCRNILIQNCLLDDIYNFSNIDSYVNDLDFVYCAGTYNVHIDGLIIENTSKNNFANKSTAPINNYTIRFRQPTNYPVIENVFTNDAFTTQGNFSFIHCEGLVKDPVIKDITANGFSNKPLITLTRNQTTDSYYICNVNNYRVSDDDVLVSIGGYYKPSDYGFVLGQGKVDNVRFRNVYRSMQWANDRYGMIHSVHTGLSTDTITLDENVCYIYNQDCTINVTGRKLKSKCAFACSTTSANNITLTLTGEYENTIVISPSHAVLLEMTSENSIIVVG